MKRDQTTPVQAVDLRRRAERQLKERRKSTPPPSSGVNAQRVAHESEVRQIELELQNEELRTARLDLETGLERYTTLFDFAPLGYATLAADQTICEINHVGARLLGRERLRLVDRPFASVVEPDSRPAFRALLRKVTASDSMATCDVQLMRAGSAAWQARLTATLLAGKDPMILLAFEDITEQEVRRKRLEQTERALLDADRRKDEFLAALSHELRNPLAPIRNSLFVLASGRAGGEQAGKALTVIERQVKHLTRLIDDLLDVTRITRGKVQLRRERVELGELVRRTMDDHRASFEASGVRLEAHFEPEPFWVDADPARIVQALSNLLGNAEKFTQREGLVVVSLRRDGTRVSLRVQDTGAGIEPDVLEHLFEPFAQAPQTIDRTRGGLGLGLAMVRGLVELHGGKVDIASKGPGRGTEVTVSLPLETPPERRQPTSDAPVVNSRRVLVIEDNHDAADTLRDALALSGHQVQVAYDGQTGLVMAKTLRPDIVICDIGLPGMSGYAVATAFRAEEKLRGTYLVALSGYAQREDVQRAADAGFNRHIAKPPSLEELELVLAAAPVANGGHGRPGGHSLAAPRSPAA
jgi:PAS domain S-box-containing protein